MLADKSLLNRRSFRHNDDEDVEYDNNDVMGEKKKLRYNKDFFRDDFSLVFFFLFADAEMR